MIEKIINKLKRALKRANSISSSTTIDSTVKTKGSTVGSSVTIDAFTTVENSIINAKAVFGKHNMIENSTILGNFTSGEYCKVYGVNLKGNITLGKFSSLWGPNLDMVSFNEKIVIGNYCSIARNVTFQPFNHNHKKITSYFIGQNLFKENWENERVSKGDILIENDVWIGTHCVVLGGVTIHNGAIVAANSVVTKDVPAYSIVAGTPAKVIGYRFDEATIQNIQELKWWNWTTEKIKKNRHLFLEELSSKDINKFNHE